MTEKACDSRENQAAPRAPSMPAAPDGTSLWRFAGPRYWPTWFGLGLIRVLDWLPFRVQMFLGGVLGSLAFAFARRERHVAALNIEMCLPERGERERHQLMRAHFASLGKSLFETALVWWAEDQRLKRIIRIDGVEHLSTALAEGKGAILLSAHFTTLEMGARALCIHHGPTAIMYQMPKNRLIAELSLRGRRRHASRAISSTNVRELLQSLKANLPVWYAPDQRDFGKSGALVPFFGRPAATNVATSRIARISGAPVLPYFPARLGDDSGYVMRILPRLEGFPSDDPVADAARFHELIEMHVRRCPEQYLWTYKRFKLPGPDGDPYRR
jgi:KDO2-lipid IV(A) lauroyltransferase